MIVSVIILAYKGAAVVGRAIESVLGQSYPHFETVVVDDASPDDTADVVRRYADPRVQYIRHATNLGANRAWMTGLKAARGDLIACLDQDDFFHPDKLRAHVQAYEHDPALGVTYNARYELRPGTEQIREIWWPPATVSLADLVTGFPFAPSDMVIRREWALRDELWDDSFAPPGDEVIVNGSEILYSGLLYLAGCRFGGIPRALTYRRRYRARVLSDVAARCTSELRCQEIILSDPRCPRDVQAQRGRAFATTYMSWATVAFGQQHDALASEFLGRAARHHPDLLEGRPAGAVLQLVWAAVADDQADHEAVLDRFFDHLPVEMHSLRPQRTWAKAAGHRIRGIRELMWGTSSQQAAEAFRRAAAIDGAVDEWFLAAAIHQLLAYEIEHGAAAAERVQQALGAHLRPPERASRLRAWKAEWAINRAFQHFHARNTSVVPAYVWQAVSLDPRFLANRGVLAMLVRAITGWRPASHQAAN